MLTACMNLQIYQIQYVLLKIIFADVVRIINNFFGGMKQQQGKKNHPKVMNCKHLQLPDEPND